MIETKEHIQRITRELIEDYINDGVIYAEIRTTPREITVGDQLSEKEGIDIIIDEIKHLETLYGDKITIRLLLSINRSESLYAMIYRAQWIGKKHGALRRWLSTILKRKSNMLLELTLVEILQ